MIEVIGFASKPGGAVSGILSLPYELRQKSRLRTQLQSGDEVGLKLPRGTVLRGGDHLLSREGDVIRVQAAPEQTSKVVGEDKLLLTKAAYHLGNRHVPLEINDEGLRYLKDHVLDEMLLKLGLNVIHEVSPFEPENGAYGGGHHH